MTLPSSAAGTITTFGYNNSGTMLPTHLNPFTITNFSQTAGNLNIPTLTIQATPASGIYSTYNLTGGSLTTGTVALTGGSFSQSGGTHSAGSINVSGTGVYNYSGGTVTGALTNNSTVNVTGTTANTFAASVSNNAAFNVNQANVIFVKRGGEQPVGDIHDNGFGRHL